MQDNEVSLSLLLSLSLSLSQIYYLCTCICVIMYLYSLFNRTKVLCCIDDKDFLAKLCCVRQAFSELLLSEENRRFTTEAGRDMIVTLLNSSNHVCVCLQTYIHTSVVVV